MKFETINKSVEQKNRDLKKVERTFKAKMIKVNNKTKIVVKKIEAFEESIMKAVKESIDFIKSFSDRFKQDLSKIRDFSDSKFKKVLDESFNYVCKRKIDPIQTEINKSFKQISDSMYSRVNGVINDVSKIRDFSDLGFKKIVDNFFEDVCIRRIVENK